MQTKIVDSQSTTASDRKARNILISSLKGKYWDGIFWKNCEGQHTCPKQKTLLGDRHKVRVTCILNFQKILLHDINNDFQANNQSLIFNENI
jgi:hypothetical protein